MAAAIVAKDYRDGMMIEFNNTIKTMHFIFIKGMVQNFTSKNYWNTAPVFYIERLICR
jgi:ribonuclease HII